MPPSPRPPPPPKPTFALRSERVAVAGGALRPATVVVEGDRIAAVLGPDEPPPPGVALADLAADLLVPGLIDCHTHLCIDDITVPMAYERELLRSSLPLRTLRAAARGRLMLDHGFTTVRDVCTEGAGYADVALAEAVEARLCEGPRVVPCGPGIAITGGYMPSGLAPGVCIP